MEGSSSDSLECHVKDGLEDFEREQGRSACFGDADYEHEDKRYCILHLPSENKEDNFKRAVQRKLQQNNFEFMGVYFPAGCGDFRKVTFSGMANFSEATFNEGAVFTSATFKARADFRRVAVNGGRSSAKPPSAEMRSSPQPPSRNAHPSAVPPSAL